MLETSRMQANRLVDLEDTSVNLNTMAKIAEAMAKKLELKFVWWLTLVRLRCANRIYELLINL